MVAVVHTSRTAWRQARSRYREARRSLRTPSSRRSRYGLDWMNFFIADVQTGFGTFVAFYLARLGWSLESIGLVLGVGALAAVLSQIPGGALSDAIRWKRGLAAIGIVMIGTAALILALHPSRGFELRHFHLSPTDLSCIQYTTSQAGPAPCGGVALEHPRVFQQQRGQQRGQGTGPAPQSAERHRHRATGYDAPDR
jgi:nitrate/nitrite transporter NarK